MLFLLPFYLLVRNGLASRAEITAPQWTLFPSTVHWENFSKLFSAPDVPFARSLLNSAIVAVLQTVGLLVMCSLAGYGLARIPYRHSRAVFYAVLATLMIPTSVTFVPSFVVVSTLGWLSDFRGLVIPGLFSAFSVSCSGSTSWTSRANWRRPAGSTASRAGACSGGSWSRTRRGSSRRSR